MKLSFTIFFSLIFLGYAYSQSKRNIPYPILFVHGWTGSDKTWYEELVSLKDQNLNVDIDYIGGGAGSGSRLDFFLNADGNSHTSFLDRSSSGPNYGDLLDMMSYVNPQNDVYVVNFEIGAKGNHSNQAAAVKQGFAVGLAVRKILMTSGADKIVLFGHSMGGLAIREYLQNSENWLTKDSQHHIAKIVTSGTPHMGSNVSSGNLLNLFNGSDEYSEAVRDLRSSVTTNYLYGGFEGNVSSLFDNKDIDCNGYENFVTGLNQRDIYTNLYYTCIIGSGGKNLLGPLGVDDDDIVTSYSANLFNIKYSVPLTGEVFVFDNSAQQSGNKYELTWHTKLPKQTFINQYALDEPSEMKFAYEIRADQNYTGFFTPHADSFDYDFDRYKLVIPQRGVLSFSSNIGKDGGVQLSDFEGKDVQNMIGNRIARVREGGIYYLGIYGSTGASSGYPLHFVRYNFSISYCPLPELPSLVSQSDGNICEGESVSLTVKNTGYESYDWYLNDKLVGSGKTFNASEEGIYHVEGKKCGITEKSINTFVLDVRVKPSKPEVFAVAEGLSSNSPIGNQWFHNGKALPGENSQILHGTGAGPYVVKVTENNCSSTSDVFVITGAKVIEIQKETSVYPNPSYGKFEIRTPLVGPLTFTILDVNGKEVTKSEMVGSGSAILLINEMIPGLYFLKIESDKVSFHKKILVE